MRHAEIMNLLDSSGIEKSHYLMVKWSSMSVEAIKDHDADESWCCTAEITQPEWNRVVEHACRRGRTDHKVTMYDLEGNLIFRQQFEGGMVAVNDLLEEAA